MLDWQTVDGQQGERQTVSRTHMKRSQAETDMQVAGRQEQVNRQQNGQTTGMGGCSRWQAGGRQVEVKQVTSYSAEREAAGGWITTCMKQ